ncbi:MAG: uracil-DNA glycosylase [Verrucomicrobiota bacterium]
MPNRRPISEGLALLAEILDRERMRGLETLSLLPESESCLQELPVMLMKRAKTSPDVVTPRDSLTEEGSQADLEESSALSEKERRVRLNEIFKLARASGECRSLGTLRETIVFAAGNPMADLMFVGEAPGAEEEKLKQPFVGPAGKKLDQIISAMGMTRDDVYISNIVKFRPKKGDGRFQGSRNRKPDATEMAASRQFIMSEIEVVDPKVIVALGATAAEGLLEVGGAIASMRQTEQFLGKVPVVVTYHPSFLLRQESEADSGRAKEMKRKVWEDILWAMEFAGLPITEKQRGYFL